MRWLRELVRNWPWRYLLLGEIDWKTMVLLPYRKYLRCVCAGVDMIVDLCQFMTDIILWFQTIGTLVCVSMPQNGINSEGICALAKAFSKNTKLEVRIWQQFLKPHPQALSRLSMWYNTECWKEPGAKARKENVRIGDLLCVYTCMCVIWC